MTRADMERRAVLLDQPRDYDPLEDILFLERLQRHRVKPGMIKLIESGELLNAGGQYWQDTRPPFNTAAYPSVTLSTTSKQLVGTSGSNPNAQIDPREWWAGKKLMIRAFGQMTSAATPGNYTWEVRWTNADAGGTILATTAALTGIASQTNISWRIECRVECWSTGNGGTSGSLVCTGVVEVGTAIIAAGQAMLPASAPAGVTVDLSATNTISIQAKRSGSTAETMQVISHEFVHLN